MGAGCVHVIATTLPGTVHALTAARHLTGRGDDPVVLLVPHASLQAGASDVRVVRDTYRQMADEVGVSVVVRVCVCQSPAAVSSLVPPGTAVVVGGTWRSWWPTAEQRLAWHLASTGHDVRFMDIQSGSAAPLRVSVSV